MKTSKRILSAILSLCMILGCVAVGFTAQAADATLQAGINAAIKNGEDVYEWKGGNVKLEDTLVINGNIKVDLNNATVTGPDGKSVVVIKGGNVELYDGTFLAVSPNYSGPIELAEVVLDYRPAVSVNGGNVTLECITAVGSTVRIPNSSTVKVTTGNGINANDGTVVLKDVIAVGMKALDNTKATVIVEDAILVGIYKAANILSKVQFADGYTQYKTIDFLEEVLKDGVTLSATEKKYINGLTNSEGDLSVASALVSVKDPAFAEPTSTYDAATDVLTVIAEADDENIKDEVANRYSYRYTPVTCTIDGVTADFAEQEDGTFAATFEGVAGGATLNAELDYELSVKLGKKQKEVVVDSLDMVSEYAKKAPEIIGRFIKDFEGDSAYGKVNEYLELAFGAYAELADNKQDTSLFDPIVGVIYALRGQNYTGNTTWTGAVTYAKKYYANKPTLLSRTIESSKKNQANQFGKIFDTDGDGVADSLYTFFGEYNEGLGLLDEFDRHYNKIKELALTADYSDFNDIGAAAEYVGENYEEIMALVDAAITVLEYGYNVIQSPDIQNFLAKNFPDLQVIVDYADKLFADGGYFEKLVAKYNELKASNFVETYGKRAPELCKRYALKALDIVQNPTKYFDISSKVEGDYLNMFSFKQEAQFTTPSDVKTCNVTVVVTGFGYASVDGGAKFSATETFAVPMGETINVSAVEFDSADPLFAQAFYALKGNETEKKVVTDLANFMVGSDVTIYVEFADGLEDEEANVVFLTDENLGFNWIGQFLGDIADFDFDDYKINAPLFKGLDFAGWAFEKDTKVENALSEEELLDAIAGRTDDFFVYAIYENNVIIDMPSDHEEIAIVKAAADSATKNVYFTVSVEAPANVKVIEAGVIATINPNKATDDVLRTDITPAGDVLMKCSDEYGSDGYLKNSFFYNLGIEKLPLNLEVFGRGYVIYKNVDTGAIETYYTDIVSAMLS